jgi:uncharacterized protein with GYD domain
MMLRGDKLLSARTAPEEKAMPHYLIEVGYNLQGVKALIEHPQAREDKIAKACESIGGRLEKLYFALGESDLIAIAEFPDNETAAAFALGTTSGGALSKYRTTVLLTPGEAVNAMRKAKALQYEPPK